MPTESPRPLTRQLLRVVLGTPDVPDRDLLARFVASRDEDAFAEIVRRHGPMVLAACRRVTGRPHDAEDAFQAAFLVLARRAAHLSRPELLANWLYGVAYRTALEARAARRRAEEHAVPAAPEPAAPPAPEDPAELRRVIDEELAKLPDKYRAAVVLCDLEGLPRATAATQLGIPEGTLSSRLAHARKVLADRLTRRGVTTSAVAVSAALSRDAVSTTLPYTLTDTTVHAVVRFGGRAVSPAVSSLTDGVLKAMLATRLRQAFGIGLLACGLIGVGGALAQQLGGPPAAAPDAPARGYTVGLTPDAAPDIQQKAADPKKVAAKGIEDDDVPYGSFPTQAVVRIEEGKLIVRQRNLYYEPVTNKVGEQSVTSYQRKSSVHASMHDPADVAVFDMKGNRLLQKAWKDALKNDVHALIASDGKLPNPRELTLFKPDTLLIVLPGSVGYPAPPVAQPFSATGYNYTPVTEYAPRTYYVPTPAGRPTQPPVPPLAQPQRTSPPVQSGPSVESVPPQVIPTPGQTVPQTPSELPTGPGGNQ
ncbi:RNA polymerase sigma factor [Frigoriglobus tundricola]|uniref:ECF RNA polymerase sigma factor SigE n=1 Tax=Frigoriglobus tundricola TaxID=2774151 RepID=A0A6M5YY64_9BACT|nr:sigma-70 family RNA polymerase sigma factor [Frigoriglobus tundricola]QJW98153.1 hypothetical protein FTUN_5733 [Frigoriglobus tundricola]